MFNAPVMVKIARAHLQLKQGAKAKEAAEHALQLDNRYAQLQLSHESISSNFSPHATAP